MVGHSRPIPRHHQKMKLYLLRHALAAERGTPGFEDDSLRPLTEEGRKKMERIAGGMKALGLSFDHILTSPYVRAHQTAEIVAATLGLKRCLTTERLLAADAEPVALLARLDQLEWDSLSVLLVGHEPYLSELGSLLIGANSGDALRMKKGGLCKMDVQQLTPHPHTQLEWLLTPRQLGAIGD